MLGPKRRSGYLQGTLSQLTVLKINNNNNKLIKLGGREEIQEEGMGDAFDQNTLYACIEISNNKKGVLSKDFNLFFFVI